MPYDLFAFVLMVILVILLLRIITKHLKHRKRIGSKKVASLCLLLLLIIAIPIFGHTHLNRELQMKQLLNSFDQQSALSPASDKKAVEELSSLPRPLQYSFLREELLSDTNIQDKFYNEYINVNGQVYIVTLACFTAPLRWTVFESCSLNQIKRQ